MEDVLVFVTGEHMQTPWVLTLPQTIEFTNEKLPSANTCGTLPAVYQEHDIFKEKMDFAILNSWFRLRQ
jgi:hypothetical protein